MKQYWTSEEITEHWLLLPDEMLLLRNKTGNTRLGFAIGLKFFQLYGRFPQYSDHVPKTIIHNIASQVNGEITDGSLQYIITKAHRQEIREFLGFSIPTQQDAVELKTWIINNIAGEGHPYAKIKELAYQHLCERSLEPFTQDQMNRHVSSALRQFEDNLFKNISAALTLETQKAIDKLLTTSPIYHKHSNKKKGKAILPVENFRLSDLKQEAGKTSLNTILIESAKLQVIKNLQLPANIFNNISRKILKKYHDRVIGERPGELRKRKPTRKYAMIAIFCHLREQEITDSLVDLLIQITHKIKTNAEGRIIKEFADDVFKVEGKNEILYKMAKASLENPMGVIQEILYPIIGEQVLQDIVKELESGQPNFRERIYTTIRSSYTHHYRRMLPALLDTLEFCANSDENNTILEAIKILRKYIDSQLINYPEQENIPTDKIIPELWRSMVLEKTDDGESYKINRANYEIAVLHTLRERIRCKEIWLKNAYYYRDPDKDLPADFDDKREENYAALNKPLDKYEFTNNLKQEMRIALDMLNSGMPKNKKVKILQIKKRKKKQQQGWICISPLKPQPDPQNINQLKGEIFEYWAATNLLDVLKETEFRVAFTSCFKSTASKEILDRTTIQERLLLCLFGVATNIGIKRIRSGNRKVSYNDLRYIYRRFINPISVRESIARIVNAIFQTRDPEFWGEATTACASDAKKFGAWDQNLMTEWHVRYHGSGIMVYWHIDKNSACIYSQLKTCSSSEVASMIEGVLRHCTEMEVKKNYTDSRGQSIIGFAFSYLLNFDLLPRLKNIGSQKLHLPELINDCDYINLQPILTKPINWDMIHAQYDLIIKYATALRLGTADSEIILKRFTRNNASHPVYKALMELGKAVKTIFLCKYLHSEELRQEIHEGLNVVENWNSVNGFISYAKKGIISTNRKRDQEISLLCLHLLQISMVYINTLMIQQIFRQTKWQNRLTIEDKRALSPLIHHHINPYGVFNLDLNTRLSLEG